MAKYSIILGYRSLLIVASHSLFSHSADIHKTKISETFKSNNGVDAFFELDYKSVKWNNDVADSVTVPSGARRYAFSDIMKLISR